MSGYPGFPGQPQAAGPAGGSELPRPQYDLGANQGRVIQFLGTLLRHGPSWRVKGADGREIQVLNPGNAQTGSGKPAKDYTGGETIMVTGKVNSRAVIQATEISEMGHDLDFSFWKEYIDFINMPELSDCFGEDPPSGAGGAGGGAVPEGGHFGGGGGGGVAYGGGGGGLGQEQTLAFDDDCGDI